MDISNPLAPSLAQSVAVTRQQSTDKSRQVRKAQIVRKDVGAASDEFEHQVESSEELAPIHDEQKKPGGKKSKQRKPAPNQPPEEPQHIDVTG
jgi:hypothetical protein